MDDAKKPLNRFCKVTLIIIVLLSVTSAVQGRGPEGAPTNHLGGNWQESPIQECPSGKICADWIDRSGDLIGSCCIDPDLIGTDDVSVCPAVASFYYF